MMTIQELIDKSLIRPPRERSGKFSPSSFGMCYRQQIWNRQDKEKSNPPDARSLRVFKAGSLFHDFVQGLLVPDKNIDSPFAKYQTEVKVESDDVLGFADMAGENEVIDIKSQHSKSFWWMAKKDCDIKKEKYSNWLQVLYYARELKKDFGRLVFISKDDLCIQEYVQPLDDYWLGELGRELFTLREIWHYGILPPVEPRCEPKKDGTFWICNYCNWRDKCKELENGQV